MAICCLIVLVFSCADPNNPYTPEMKHKTSGTEYMDDMYRSPSYETYSENPNFTDKVTARKPVAGTIPRGYMPYPYPNTNDGYEAAGANLKNPVPLTSEILAEGKGLFMKFCVHCHGPQGKGDGILVLNGKFPPPPSYITGVSSGGGDLINLPEGKMFHTITYGRNLMGSHASQLSVAERWKIIHFIHFIQHEKSDSLKSAAGENQKKTTTIIGNLEKITVEPVNGGTRIIIPVKKDSTSRKKP